MFFLKPEKEPKRARGGVSIHPTRRHPLWTPPFPPVNRGYRVELPSNASRGRPVSGSLRWSPCAATERRTPELLYRCRDEACFGSLPEQGSLSVKNKRFCQFPLHKGAFWSCLYSVSPLQQAIVCKVRLRPRGRPKGFPIALWKPSDASSLIWPLTHHSKPKGLGDYLYVGFFLVYC